MEGPCHQSERRYSAVDTEFAVGHVRVLRQLHLRTAQFAAGQRQLAHPSRYLLMDEPSYSCVASFAGLVPVQV